MLLNCGVGEDSESPLDCKEIKPDNPQGNQSWIFIGRTDAEAETSILWPPDAKNWLIGEDPDAETDWRWEGKRTTEDGMIGWHHQLNEHEFEQAPGVGDGQGALACCMGWKSWTRLSDWTGWTGKNLTLSCAIKKEKIKQIDETRENTINCLVICNLKEMELCASVKVHVWERQSP